MLVILEHPGLLADAHHERDIGSVDVCIDQTDAEAHLGQRSGQVHGERGFAHSTFAGTDGDDVRYSGDGLRAGRCLCVSHINLS